MKTDKVFARTLLPMIGVLMLLAPIQAQKRNSQKPERPNIIFILTDDQRWSALGYAGNDIIQTPEMDNLATEGVYFNTAPLQIYH